MSERCENCGTAIGNLEPAHVWKDHVVCARCHRKLKPPVPAAVPVAVPIVRPKPQPVKAEIVEAVDVIDASPIAPAPDPLAQIALASAMRHGPAPQQQAYAAPQMMQTIVHVNAPAGRPGRGLIIAGIVLMVCSLPLTLVYGLGCVTFAAGFILFIVGLCL